MAEEQKNKEYQEENETKTGLLPTSQGKRFLNNILDLFFSYIFAYVFGLVMFTTGLFFLIENMNEYLFGIIVATTYYVLFEYIWSKTPAKFITKTRVIMENGEKPEFGDVFKRTLIRFVPFEAFSFLTDSRPRGWHDRWSKTVVIDDKPIVKSGNKETSANELLLRKKLETKNKIYCSQCGNGLDSDSKFCVKCGTKI